MAECIHELEEAWCSTCKKVEVDSEHIPRRGPRNVIHYKPHLFPAKYPGHCSDCNLPIMREQMIHAIDGKYFHDGCAG